MMTQSKQTLCHWSLDYAKLHVLPFFEKACPNDPRPRHTLCAAEAYLAGNLHFYELRRTILWECHAAARELEKDPVAQAAARACAQAASAAHAPGHALAVLFYAAAAIAYDRLGFGATKEAYDDVAEEVCHSMTAALIKVAVADEAQPVRINWRL